MLQSQITRSTWLVLSACNASGALLAVSASWPKRASAFVSTPRTDGSWSTRRTVAIVVGLTIELECSYVGLLRPEVLSHFAMQIDVRIVRRCGKTGLARLKSATNQVRV